MLALLGRRCNKNGDHWYISCRASTESTPKNLKIAMYSNSNGDNRDVFAGLNCRLMFRKHHMLLHKAISVRIVELHEWLFPAVPADSHSSKQFPQFIIICAKPFDIRYIWNKTSLDKQSLFLSGAFHARILGNSSNVCECIGYWADLKVIIAFRVVFLKPATFIFYDWKRIKN